MTRCARSGFALLAVLWMIVGMTVMALLLSVQGRQALATAQHRRDLARGRWQAEGCLERVRMIASTLINGQVTGSSTHLHQNILVSPYLASTGCDVVIRPSGMTVDINLADSMQLHRLFAAVNLRASFADSLTDAILDWRDGDDVPRPLGAERDWYLAHGERPPRNAAFADVRELYRVRGYTDAVALVPALDTLLGVGSDPITPMFAPLPVVASLPHVDAQMLDRIAAWRAIGGSDNDRRINVLTDSLLHDAGTGALAVHDPTFWTATARGCVGPAPQACETLEVVLTRAGNRVGIIRRRSWP